MDFTLSVLIPQIILSVTATVSSLLFIIIIHTTYFPLHVKTAFGGLIFGSGMLAFGHLGYVVTEFKRGRNILYGDGVVYWCQLVHGFGLSFHTISFFVLSLDRLLLVIFPSLLDSLNRFSRLIAFLILFYCVVHSSSFVLLLYYSSMGSYLTMATLCINLLIIPISCIGYIWSRTKYRRTVAILKLNVRYELASIRELTRIIFPIAVLDAILSSIAFSSAYLMGLKIIPVLTHVPFCSLVRCVPMIGR